MADGSDSLTYLLSALGTLALSVAAWVGGRRSIRMRPPEMDLTNVYLDGPLNVVLSSVRACEVSLKHLEDGLATIARQQRDQFDTTADQGRTVAEMRGVMSEQIRILKQSLDCLQEISDNLDRLPGRRRPR